MKQLIKVLAVDDDADIRSLIKHFLVKAGFEVIVFENGRLALDYLKSNKPDIILLDIMMPELNGYEVCASLKNIEVLKDVPVIFISAKNEEKDKIKAFALGASDYLVKPFDYDNLVKKIESIMVKRSKWLENEKIKSSGVHDKTFGKFKNNLIEIMGISNQINLDKIKLALNIKNLALAFNVSQVHIIKAASSYLNIPYLDIIDPDEIEVGILPISFCRANSIVIVKGEVGLIAVLSDPFNFDIIDAIKRHLGESGLIALSDPEAINPLLKADLIKKDETAKDIKVRKKEREIFPKVGDTVLFDIEKIPVKYISQRLLEFATISRASDIHFEPKEDKVIVRIRVDGDMKDFMVLKKERALMVVSRFKALAEMDITQRRRPQDGSFTEEINRVKFIFRVATTSTIYGESLIIRIIQLNVKPSLLEELGFSEKQTKILKNFLPRTSGILLIVGPTGSGKTTTTYSFLSQMDLRTRSLITVEDPVEYRIPYANHQQVNEKAQVTFEALLKSSVRQDPDILFLGETRDAHSAKILFDFSSTGHLVVTTMHTSNATSAIFRLQRLGISTSVMTDSIIGIVAQRLIKKLCVYCKSKAPITDDEKKKLVPFVKTMPTHMAHPVGCPKCSNTGYIGREGIYEIIPFTPEVAEMVRSGRPVSVIRDFIKGKGIELISASAAEKVAKNIFDINDVYEKVLIEEFNAKRSVPLKPEKNIDNAKKPAENISKKDVGRKILVVDDDVDMRVLISQMLEKSEFQVQVATDGIEALMALGRGDFDLIISDIEMPNLDGLKLMEMLNQKNISTPVIFLTSRFSEEDEALGLELGAADYISKPLRKDTLLIRVKKVLKRRK